MLAAGAWNDGPEKAGPLIIPDAKCGTVAGGATDRGAGTVRGAGSTLGAFIGPRGAGSIRGEFTGPRGVGSILGEGSIRGEPTLPTLPCCAAGVFVDPAGACGIVGISAPRPTNPAPPPPARPRPPS